MRVVTADLLVKSLYKLDFSHVGSRSSIFEGECINPAVFPPIMLAKAYCEMPINFTDPFLATAVRSNGRFVHHSAKRHPEYAFFCELKPGYISARLCDGTEPDRDTREYLSSAFTQYITTFPHRNTSTPQMDEQEFFEDVRQMLRPQCTHVLMFNQTCGAFLEFQTKTERKHAKLRQQIRTAEYIARNSGPGNAGAAYSFLTSANVQRFRRQQAHRGKA